MFSELVKNRLMSYVYILCDENYIQLYVGKGTGDRIFKHEMESIESTHNLLKYNKIHEIMDRGYQVKKYIVHSGLTESEAYACELALMKLLSFKNIPLTNDVNGHHDIFAHCLTPEQIESRVSDSHANLSVFLPEHRVLAYFAKPATHFSIETETAAILKTRYAFLRGKELPLYLAVFHKKILEGFFRIQSEQFDEERTIASGAVQRYHRIKITEIVDDTLYSAYYRYEFTDVYTRTEHKIRELY